MTLIFKNPRLAWLYSCIMVYLKCNCGHVTVVDFIEFCREMSLVISLLAATLRSRDIIFDHPQSGVVYMISVLSVYLSDDNFRKP